VFQVANANRMAIAVHLRPSFSRRRPYGRVQAETFLSERVSAAPDVTIQIAHLAGGGGFDDAAAEEALGVFIGVIANRDPRMNKVCVDASGVAGIGRWSEKRAR
jgi:hypothetical protein